MKPIVDSVKAGQEKIMGCVSAACQDQETTAKKAQRNIDKLGKHVAGYKGQIHRGCRKNKNHEDISRG